jgi:hypothetical protein
LAASSLVGFERDPDGAVANGVSADPPAVLERIIGELRELVSVPDQDPVLVRVVAVGLAGRAALRPAVEDHLQPPHAPHRVAAITAYSQRVEQRDSLVDRTDRRRQHQIAGPDGQPPPVVHRVEEVDVAVRFDGAVADRAQALAGVVL